MAGGHKGSYKVDLDALDQVVKDLNAVLKDMGGPKNKAANNTSLSGGVLGKNFAEQTSLHDAHEKMTDFINEHVIDLIEELVDDFGKRSKKAKEAYDDAEANSKMK